MQMVRNDESLFEARDRGRRSHKRTSKTPFAGTMNSARFSIRGDSTFIGFNQENAKIAVLKEKEQALTENIRSTGI